ncbi:quinoprotein relay system zinc metallohydrolase 2 [Methylobrevis pamukkalensis]|nr:quinoprotein relay system zinc metallohydrolase 2 [Methylobrevis pamukkalensis]
MLAPAASRAAEDEIRPLAVSQIAPGVFVHQGVHGLMTAENGGAIANVGFVVGEDAVAVIDTGGSLREGRALLAAVRAATPLPVRYVINTHMHPDHVFGNAAFEGLGAEFVGHARLAAALEARGAHYLAANRDLMGDRLLAGVRIVLPSQPVDGSVAVDLGGRILRLDAWPVAHTDNDLTVFVPDAGVLFTGDLLFVEHLPSVDGSLRGWQKVIDSLLAMPVKALVPGHGPVPTAFPEGFEAERRYFDVLATDLRAAIDAGIPLSEAAKTAGRSEAANWVLFDEFNTRNATAAYAELEWE